MEQKPMRPAVKAALEKLQQEREADLESIRSLEQAHSQTKTVDALVRRVTWLYERAEKALETESRHRVMMAILVSGLAEYSGASAEEIMVEAKRAADEYLQKQEAGE